MKHSETHIERKPLVCCLILFDLDSFCHLLWYCAPSQYSKIPQRSFLNSNSCNHNCILLIRKGNQPSCLMLLEVGKKKWYARHLEAKHLERKPLFFRHWSLGSFYDVLRYWICAPHRGLLKSYLCSFFMTWNIKLFPLFYIYIGHYVIHLKVKQFKHLCNVLLITGMKIRWGKICHSKLLGSNAEVTKKIEGIKREVGTRVW